MGTALIDNSLCIFTLRDDASPEHIYNYIETLGKAGVKYVELDFRAVMKLRSLPTNVGYIFRMIDPMFLKLCEIFKFDYIHFGTNDIKKGIKTDVPVMLGLDAGETVSFKTYQYANQVMNGNISAVRMRGSFQMMTQSEAERYILGLKGIVPVPIDVCPMNGRKNSLDTALKFAQSGVDSLTLTMGYTDKYCSLEEYFFALLTIYEKMPKQYSVSSLCKAAVYQKYIFKNCGDKLSEVLQVIDHDILHLKNADTGENVRMRARIKEMGILYKGYVSAFEKMADNSGIPDDMLGFLEEAIRQFDASLYDNEILVNRKRTFLN